MSNARVGGEVDSYCGRCKLKLAHTVLAIASGRIARVRCNTCQSDHALRGLPSADAASRPARTTERPAKVVLSFEDQLASRNVAAAKPYRPQETYADGQVISHPTFGVGFVSAVRGDKVDIVFKASTRTLVQGRGAAPAAKPSYKPAPAPSDGASDKPQAGHEAEAE
ncbi:MAG: hypothetical protein ACKVPX_12765 [Myxococcaceae bacterium]